MNPVGLAHDQIRNIVSQVRQETTFNGKDIELRWLNDIGDHSLTLFDPEPWNSQRGFSNRAWLVIEFMQENKPSRRINKQENPKVFQDYVAIFERHWNQATQLKEEDWAQWTK